MLSCALFESLALVEALAAVLSSTCLTEDESLTLALIEELSAAVVLVSALVEALVEAEAEFVPEPTSFMLSLIEFN
ncbi:hypothetical protein M3M35_06855 [Fructilactobacillus myrtifloralis]|uniref:Secreted protein n=1 Tax=Fructilactobacillus myrtifloralis TaxID=2940301 RepID=A0ABY5BQY8_9LACO|nr:hypothetical protein [Fructilactobacillus myrtifloralis]USS85001.1 hypothetical protein M3M35_06855 [Fructilactobacillus myrtifloralis]